MRELLITLLVTVMASSVIFGQSANQVKPGQTIAFLRNNDIWLMESDGSNQRPFVTGLANVRGRMSWSPDNRHLAFARQGELSLRFPDGGGGSHRLYDLFYAYSDSTNNWWEAITETMGAMAPEFSRDGTRILFLYDLNANLVNSSFPRYRLSFYDTKTFATRVIEFEPASQVAAFSPTMSPDMKQAAFVVMRFQAEQMTPAGTAIVGFDEFPIKDEAVLERARRLPNATAPSWSPDGQWIAYVSNDLSKPWLHIVKPDLSETKVLYMPSPPLGVSPTPPSWSPDSKMITFSTQNGAIYKISINGGDPIRLSGPGNDYSPAWCN